MERYLVVANQTLGGDQLLAEVRRRAAAGPSSFYVIVPNTRSGDVDEHRATLTAQAHLSQVLTQLRTQGLDARGDIGDPEPLTAIEDALAGQPFDEITISTLPSGISHWLRMDLPQRVERKFKLPVTTVTTRHRRAALRRPRRHHASCAPRRSCGPRRRGDSSQPTDRKRPW